MLLLVHPTLIATIRQSANSDGGFVTCAHLLVAEAEGLSAQVAVQLQHSNQVSDSREDGETQNRVNMDP